MIPIVGAGTGLERLIRLSLGRFPQWFVNAARVARIVVEDNEHIADQIAMYEHGSRQLTIWTRMPPRLAQKAIGHELAHGVDDNFENPHFFTSTEEWKQIHKNQGYFDLPKYRDEPLEYFADQVTKIFLLGPERMKTTNPDEVRFILSWVWPTLQRAFA